MRGQSARLPAGAPQSGLQVRRAGARSRALVHGSRASDERPARHFVSTVRACSRGARLTVTVLAWSRPAAWKGMLNALFRSDQRAKKQTVFSCQFGCQLAIQTAQKLSNCSPVHSVRDRGVGGSNPLAPTNKNGQKLDEKALQLWRAFFICASIVGGSRVTQVQVGRVGCSVATLVATCGYKNLTSTVIK